MVKMMILMLGMIRLSPEQPYRSWHRYQTIYPFLYGFLSLYLLLFIVIFKDFLEKNWEPPIAHLKS